MNFKKLPLYSIYALGRLLQGSKKKESIYLKILYKYKMRKKLNLINPTTYNEKLQWLKLNDRNPYYSKLVDKFEVKKIVAELIGEEYIVPNLGVWCKFDAIDFNLLPDQFVLKTTHDSGGVVICRNKENFDIKEAKTKLQHHLKRNYYLNLREWPYKNVTPRIIAEDYLINVKNQDLKDYKFFCFDGVAKAMFIASERSNPLEETKFDFYDMEFNHLDFTNGHPNAEISQDKPQNFEVMKKLAEKLSESLPHARIDFFEVNGKVYFGEITFFHWSGLVPFKPEKWDAIFGEWLKLPKKRN